MSGANDNLENRLSSILSDPGAMSSIMNIIKNISTTPTKPDIETTFAPAQANTNSDIFNNQLSAASSHGIDSKSIGLLCAIKPFLNDDRAKKLDVITQIIKVISLGDLLR